MTSSHFWLASLLLLTGCGGEPTSAASEPQVRSQVVVVGTGAPARPHIMRLRGGDTLYALASSDEDTDEDPPPVTRTPEHVHTPDCIHNKLAAAEGAEEVVGVQVEIIEGQQQKADDINDELAAIIEKLRREKGLPAKEPYMDPKQIAAESKDRAAEEAELLALEPNDPLEAEGPPRVEIDPMAAELSEEQVAAEPQEPVEKKDD
ncbi:MAG: hypothetical protein E4G90_06745 [Gemmatimonadales bacterium]|nr:MAG: hypothetical protein E4G90_06745 [Gemmatimonadales bacterium]